MVTWNMLGQPNISLQLALQGNVEFKVETEILTLSENNVVIFIMT